MTKKELSKKLEEALKECAQLREENMRLRDLLVLKEKRDTLQQAISSQKLPVFTDGIKVNSDSPAEAKINLFRGLFRGREDVSFLSGGNQSRAGLDTLLLVDMNGILPTAINQK